MKTCLFSRRVRRAPDPGWPRRGGRRSRPALQRPGGLLLAAALGILVVLMVCPQPSVARDWRGVRPGGWGRASWALAPPAYFFPASPPYSSRFYYPPGTPLSYDDTVTGMTYCLSPRSGIYYMCGYARPTGEAIESTRIPPPPPYFPGEQGLPAPSGVLLFRLPQDGEAKVDGVPVGLSGGLGVTSVPPGRHQVLVRASGSETEHTVTVRPHAIFMVTPTAIVPTEP